MHPLDDHSLARLFTEARTHHAFLDRGIADEDLARLYDLAKWAPTAFNMSPARFVFVKSSEAKETLCSALMPANVQQTRQAAVTVIMATDTRFYDHLPALYPAYDARPIFADNAELAAQAGFRNATLQAGYFILAARAMGLDVGPMSGFDAARVDALFFPDGLWRSNFLLNLGYGDPSGLYPRGPRLAFDEVARIV